jgi:hypothetical protein
MKNNNKIFIILSIFFLLSLLLVVFFIWPTLKEIEKNSKALILAKNNIVNLDAQIIETKNFQKNYATYAPNFKKIDQIFFNQNNPVDFIKFLEDAAVTSNVVSQTSLPPLSNGGDQTFIIFQISSTGSFPGVYNFLKKIETGPYLIETENLTIQNSLDKAVPKDYSLRNVSATFTIKVFIEK